MLPPVSYSTICANMSANNLVLCFVFILFLERGKKKKNNTKAKTKNYNNKKQIHNTESLRRASTAPSESNCCRTGHSTLK